jgi:hypothetical protein
MKENKMKISLGFLDVLTLIFIALKLTNVIAWSWWWVLSPMWIPVSVFIICFLVWVIYNCIIN